MTYKIYINRQLIVPPIADREKRRILLDVLVDNGNEWTHFTHIHYKAIIKYNLLYKRDRREIFHYKSRRLYPLPFFDDYIIFRDYRPEQLGFRTLYYHIKSGNRVYVNSHTKEMPDGSIEQEGEYVFELPTYWKYAPGFFFWVFKRRMRTLIKEDDALVKERLKRKGFDSQVCRPIIPETYDLFDALYGDTMPEADIRFTDRSNYTEYE